MIKRIRRSLTAKIFLITSGMLLAACFLTYGFIAYFMPITYSWGVNEEAEQKVVNLIQELEQTDFKDSGPLFDDFILNSQGSIITLYDEQHNEVELPGTLKVKMSVDSSSALTQGQDTTMIAVQEADAMKADADAEADIEVSSDTEVSVDNEAMVDSEVLDNSEASIDSWQSAKDKDNNTTSIATTITSDMGIGVSNQYNVSFKDSENQYLLVVVSTSVQAVNQAEQAMGRILPWLFLCILCISLLASFFYSWYVTGSVVKLSRISKKMSKLDFDWQCDEKRTDEIGILARSLNELSDRLSTALKELQEANRSLQTDIEQERLLEQKRLEFFSAVSHELKTPVTIIKGQMEGMIHQVGVYKDRDKYLVRSYQVACTMEELVQEILTVSRMESSGFSLAVENLDFTALVKGCMHKQEDLFLQKEMVIEKDISGPFILQGDKKMLQKVVNNIISNAFHYSSAGSRIRVNLEKLSDSVTLRVENFGVHLDEESIPRLFDAFYRTEKSRNRNTGGSGLGLYIVKMILEFHKAEYQIENTSAGVAFLIKFHKET